IAMEQGKVLKLKDLNSGFTKAETIALAYFEASLLVDHIVKSKGEAALRQLLLTYGDGTEGDAAIQKGLGITIDQLQTTFDASLDARFSSIRAALRDQPQGRERDVNPFDAESHAGLGRIALKRKDATLALREFNAALVTGAADKASAHCDLADAYLLAAKPAEAKREALAALEIAPSFERAQDLLLKSVEGKGGQ